MFHNLRSIDLPTAVQKYTYTAWVVILIALSVAWRFVLPPPPPPPPPRHSGKSSPRLPPPRSSFPASPFRLLILLLVTVLLDNLCVHMYHVVSSGNVIITGCSSGIGRAAAISLAKEFDAFTIYAGVRKQRDVASLSDEGLANLIPIILDVTNDQHIQSAVQLLLATKRPLVALVNNAGIAVSDGPIEIVDLRRWRILFDVNIFGLLSVTQNFLPMLRSSRGRVVNVGSIAGDISQPMWGPYSSSKHALEAITDSLRVEMRTSGVSVSLIKPGEIKTNIYAKAMLQDPEGKLNKEASKWNVNESLKKVLAQSRGTKEQHRLYEPGLKESLKFVHHVATQASDLECPTVIMTNNAITHAITSSSPRTRYTFGGGAAMWMANLLLPDKVTDVLHHWLFNLDGWQFFHGGPGTVVLNCLNVFFYW